MRLVTRPDLDGLTCAVLLSECETIDSIELLQPQDVTDRRIPIGPADVLANLPYHPQCGMWFDNHLLTDAKAMPAGNLPESLASCVAKKSKPAQFKPGPATVVVPVHLALGK